MFSIGELSRRTNVKVPTIRYYEDVGLMAPPDRTEGNQRRYDRTALECLSFIKHARDLGFSVDAIRSLAELQNHPERSCQAATDITVARLSEVRAKIRKLRALEKELVRIANGCDGAGASGDCYIMASLADHDLCHHEH